MAALGGSRHALINLSTQIDIPPIIKKSLSPATGYFGHKDEQSHHLNTLTMIGKGKSISHGVAALEYDLAKEINGQSVATEIARHELYGRSEERRVGKECRSRGSPYH